MREITTCVDISPIGPKEIGVCHRRVADTYLAGRTGSRIANIGHRHSLGINNASDPFAPLALTLLGLEFDHRTVRRIPLRSKREPRPDNGSCVGHLADLQARGHIGTVGNRDGSPKDEIESKQKKGIDRSFHDTFSLARGLYRHFPFGPSQARTRPILTLRPSPVSGACDFSPSAMTGMHALEAGHDVLRRPKLLEADGGIVKFMEQTDFHTMKPADQLAAGSSKWALASPRDSYSAYTYACSAPIGVKGLAAGRCVVPELMGWSKNSEVRHLSRLWLLATTPWVVVRRIQSSGVAWQRKKDGGTERWILGWSCDRASHQLGWHMPLGAGFRSVALVIWRRVRRQYTVDKTISLRQNLH